ncbi:hypothetical protein BGX27_007847 [Mortierella sp. AM989]|nr:hypothetical protein BGX27_007847 [Mortierella sp. AM989]
MPTSPPVPYRSSRWPARFMVSMGIGHTIAGLCFDSVRTPFFQAIKSGYFNKFYGVERCHALWLFIGGVNMVILGRFMNWYLFPNSESDILIDNRINHKDGKQVSDRQHRRREYHSDRRLPRELGYWLVGLSVAGAAAMPKTGFFLFGLQGLAILFTE